MNAASNLQKCNRALCM